MRKLLQRLQYWKYEEEEREARKGEEKREEGVFLPARSSMTTETKIEDSADRRQTPVRNEQRAQFPPAGIYRQGQNWIWPQRPTKALKRLKHFPRHYGT